MTREGKARSDLGRSSDGRLDENGGDSIVSRE